MIACCDFAPLGSHSLCNSLTMRLHQKVGTRGQGKTTMSRVCDIGLRGYRVLRSESKQQVFVHLALEREPDCCRCCASTRIVAKGRVATARSASELLWAAESSAYRDPAIRMRVCGRSFCLRRPVYRLGSAAPSPGDRRSTASITKVFAPRRWHA